MEKPTILKSNGHFVERIELEYDPGSIVRANIHLTKYESEAYKFMKEELDRVNGFLSLIEG